MRYFDIHTHRLGGREENIWRLHSLSLSEAQAVVWENRGACFSAGLHPWQKTTMQELDAQIYQLEQVIRRSPSLWAIGECGLDRLTGQSMDEQQIVFQAQIELSERYQKPLIVHCVRAYSELLRLRKQAGAHQPWIIHGYRGGIELARQLQKHDLYLSFGSYFYTNIFTSVDMCRILLETDDEPDLTIQHVYSCVADASGLLLADLCRQIEANVSGIFPQLSSR